MPEQSRLYRRHEEENWPTDEMDGLGTPSILLVEDDEDFCRLLVELLETAGFTTATCRSAEEALEQLREQQFDLVLADYLLPNRSGGWLLKEAAAEGLLDATPALIITAHPDPADVEGVEVLAKPLDVEGLIDRVRLRLGGAGSWRPPRLHSIGAPHGGDGDGRGDCPGRIELILYVNDRSASSAKALKDIKTALSSFRSPRVKLTLLNVAGQPEKGRADGGGSPASRSHVPRTFILSHATNPELVLDLLKECQKG